MIIVIYYKFIAFLKIQQVNSIDNQNLQEMNNIQSKLNDYTKEINQLKSGGIRYKPAKVDVEIERLLNQKFYNPYDVLLLQSTANDEDVKKQYRGLSLLLHPDRCKDPRAKDAFQIVQQAHKTLLDGQKKKVYLRIMREAKQRATFQRQKQNQKRQKNGQLPLDDSTFPQFYQQICNKIFKDLDDKKNHLIKMQQSKYQRNIEELETRRMVQQYKILTQEQWQRSRQKRVSNWRQFNQKKFVVGSRRSDGSIRPPPTKSQARPNYTTIQDKKKNI